MPRDLTATAAANDATRSTDSDALVASTPGARLHRFRQASIESVMGMNAHGWKVVEFDRSATVLHARELAIRAAGSTVAGLAAFARDPFAASREAFEDIWTGGRTAIYGALNIGNTGVNREYGPYCLVVDAPDALPATLAVFPGNSAERYTDATGALLEALAVAEATSWDHRHHAATVERAPMLATDPSDSDADVLCAPDRFIEVVRTGPCPLSKVTEIRMSRVDRKEGRRLRFRVSSKDPTLTNPLERKVGEVFEVFASWERTMGTTITAY